VKDIVKEIKKALETLGLPSLVSFKDIKNRYHSLAKRYHPDITGEDEKIEKINKAYKILKEYAENYKFSFTNEEILKQFPYLEHKEKFKF